MFTKSKLPTADQALPGREQPLPIPDKHVVTGRSLRPGPADQVAVFGMGCFWGVERLFWELSGVLSTAAGYAGGVTPNPTYEEVCSGKTGHTEVVLVIFNREKIDYEALLRHFWEGHDPTQGMGQGNDRGTQYRSAIFWHNPEQEAQALASVACYQERLSQARYGTITTEIAPAGPFYYAEAYHQQYLAKNPNGYCGLARTGVQYPPVA